LGNGEVPLKEVVSAIKTIPNDIWVIAEVDHPRRDPQTTVLACANWLFREAKLLRKEPRPARPDPPVRFSRYPRSKQTIPDRKEAEFREALMYASVEEIDTFYDSVAAALFGLIPCKMVNILTVGAKHNHMSLLATYPANLNAILPRVWKPDDLLIGIALRRRAAVTIFNLLDPRPGERFGFPERQYRQIEVKQRLGLHTVVALPIYNSGNQNYIRLLIAIYPEDKDVDTLPTPEQWYHIGRIITIAADSMLERLCSSAAARVNNLAAKCEDLASFYEGLIRIVTTELKCRAASIFLETHDGQRLECVATTWLEWLVPEGERFYRKGQGLTGKVWDRGEPLISQDAKAEPEERRSRDLPSEGVDLQRGRDQDACLIVPLVNVRGRVIGVVRCTNKALDQTGVHANMFSDDDAALLDSICSAAAPQLRVITAEDLHGDAIAYNARESSKTRQPPSL
jgi:hypothetical protein